MSTICHFEMLWCHKNNTFQKSSWFLCISTLNCHIREIFFNDNLKIFSSRLPSQNKKLIYLTCVIGLKTIVRLWNLDLQADCPPCEFFLRDPSSYLREFRRTQRKTPNSYFASAIGNWTWHLSSISFGGRTAQPLVWHY